MLLDLLEGNLKGSAHLSLTQNKYKILPGQNLNYGKRNRRECCPSTFGLAEKRKLGGSVKFCRREWNFLWYLPQLADSRADLVRLTPHMAFCCKVKMRRPP